MWSTCCPSAAIQFAVLAERRRARRRGFRQAVLRDPAFGGAYSLWFTTPVSFAASDAYFQPRPATRSCSMRWAQLLAERARSVPLRWQERRARSAISTRLWRRCSARHGVRVGQQRARYGLPAISRRNRGQRARSARIVRSSFDAYVSAGMPFAAWDDQATPATSRSEPSCGGTSVPRHAEQAKSYLVPLSRVMRLLRTFNQQMLAQYDPYTDSVAASTFRRTLMVAALSYGFQEDLRAEFAS